MVVFGNRKYACLSCIRGHRSSSCEHKDRILLQIRKPGRKSQAEPQGRFALVWRDSKNAASNGVSKGCGKSGTLQSQRNSEYDYKLIHVPNVENELESDDGVSVSETTENDDVVVTNKYIFVHVGDNLFRRELRPEFASAESLKKAKTPPLLTEDKVQNNLADQVNTGSNLEASNGFPLVNNTEKVETSPLGDSFHLKTENDSIPPFVDNVAPPLVIGPMQYQNDFINRQENILNELGITAEEASSLWPDDPSSFSFASQCVLPGQCQCGDSCQCPDCHEHRHKHPH